MACPSAARAALIFDSLRQRLFDPFRRKHRVERQRFGQNHFSEVGLAHFLQQLNPITIRLDQRQVRRDLQPFAL